MGDKNNHKYTIFITFLPQQYQQSQLSIERFSAAEWDHAHLNLLNDLIVTGRPPCQYCVHQCVSELQKLYTPMNLIYENQH